VRDKRAAFLVISAIALFAAGAAAVAPQVEQQIPVVDKDKIIRTDVMVTVPDLTGKREGVEVAKTLDKAGLRVGGTAYEPTPAGWQVRVVLRQNPAAGSKLPKGGRVDIFVTLGPAGGPRDVRVPAVVGQTIEEATRNLERVGLLTDVISSFARPSPVNVVDRQDPAADRTARVGTRVTLSASSDVLVPNVVGLTEARAYGLITANKLRVGAIRRSAAGERESVGVVREQSPAASTRVRQDSAVDFTLTVEAMVPRLTDLTEAQARALLERQGFLVGEVSYREMPGYYREGVVDQAPPAGQAARRGSAVSMTVGVFIPREIVFKAIHVSDDTDPYGSGEIWVRAEVNGTAHMIGRNLAIESGGYATLNYTVSIPPYSFPPPDSYIRLRVEARDDDSGFAWANVFEVGEYESLGATPDITFPRSPADSRANMYGKGTNSVAADKFRIVFEIR
jgi:beta-lactam-binding protein with PASTA domain